MDGAVASNSAVLRQILRPDQYSLRTSGGPNRHRSLVVDSTLHTVEPADEVSDWLSGKGFS